MLELDDEFEAELLETFQEMLAWGLVEVDVLNLDGVANQLRDLLFVAADRLEQEQHGGVKREGSHLLRRETTP